MTFDYGADFDAPIDEVWSAITDPARLGAWFGEVTGDLRPGGQYEVEEQRPRR